MRVVVRKSGKSASVRIPASVMAAASLSIGQMVEIREKGGRIVIEPMRAPVYDIDKLLDEMKPETFPEDFDFGRPVGGEVS